MKIQSVDSIQLPIPLGGSFQARSFYQGALGLREVRAPLLDRPGTLRFSLGSQRLDLVESCHGHEIVRTRLTLQIHNLTDLTEKLLAANLRVDDSALYDDGRVFIEDPFGHRLELLSFKHIPIESRVTQVRFAL